MLAFQEIQQYMQVAKSLAESFETKGQPAGLVMSPIEFVEEIKNQAGILLNKSDNPRISSMAA